MTILNRPAPNENLDEDIANLIRLGSCARFNDYVKLKSGFDYWSDRQLPELRRRAGQQAAEAIRALIVGDAAEASALRWHLRGLPVALAVRKVRADAEVSTNAHAAGKGRAPGKEPSQQSLPFANGRKFDRIL